jgi:outer membrane protein assembly factor BamB
VKTKSRRAGPGARTLAWSALVLALGATVWAEDAPATRPAGRAEAVRGGAVVFGSAVPAGGDPAAAGKSATDDKSDSGPVRRFVYLDESLEINDLVHKAEYFEMQDNWPKAFDLYQQVLSSAKETMMVRLDERTYGNLRVYLRKRMAALPRERLHQYRLLYDHAAKQLLAEALNPLALERLDQVTTTYFATSYGDDALDLLGDVYHDRGEWGRAVSLWRQVLEVYPDTDLPRAQIAAKIVAGYLALGERRRAESALKVLAAAAGADGQVVLAGRSLPLVAQYRAAVDLLPQIAVAPVTKSTFPQVGGSAQHVALVEEAGPADVRTWNFPLAPPPKPPQNNPYVNMPGYANLISAAPPLYCPVASGGRVFVHDEQKVYAIDAASGLLAWQSAEPVASPRDAPLKNVVISPYGYSAPGAQTACAISDGRVFAVLGGSGQSYRLAAFDEATGKALWQEALTVVPVLAGSGQVSQPVAEAGMVYVQMSTALGGSDGVNGMMAGSGHLEHVVQAFDAETGQTRWRRAVCTASSGANPYLPYISSGAQLTVPAVDAQRVYVSTDGGAVAALDARSGEVIWATLYEKAPTIDTSRFFMLLQQPSGKPIDPPWRSSAPMLLGDRVYVTPTDSDLFMCLDAETGRLIWQVPRDGAEYALGVCDGRFFTVGRRVTAIDAADGRFAWRSPEANLKPAGRPFLTAHVLFVPTTDRVLRFDPQTGKVLGAFRYNPREAAVQAGNLLWCDQTLVSVSSTFVNGFGDRTKVMAELDRRIQEDPRDAAAFYQRAEVHSQSEEYEPAIADYEHGLAVCPADLKYQDLTLRDTFRGRLYEHHTRAFESLAKAGQKDQALTHAQACLGYATSPALRLDARLNLVDAHTALADWTDVGNVWQDVLLQDRDVPCAAKDGSTTNAGAVARAALEKLLQAHGRAFYAAHDAKAKVLLDTGERRNLELVLAAYPTSASYLPAMRALGDVLSRGGDVRGATMQYGRYLRLGGADDRAQTYVKLIDAQAQAGRMPLVRRTLDRLLAERPTDVVEADGRRLAVANYVAAMKARPEIAALPKTGELILPDLSLPMQKTWTLQTPAMSRIALPADRPDTRSVYYVSNGQSIVSLDPQTGEKNWELRPPGFNGVQSTACDGASILAADAQQRLACINLKGGKVEWARTMPEMKVPPAAVREDPNDARAKALAAMQVRANVTGLALSDQAALALRQRFVPGQNVQTCEVLLFDRMTGQVRWVSPLTGYPQHGALMTDDAVVLAVTNPARLIVLELDDGTVRHTWQVGQGNVNPQIMGPPIAVSPDLVCAVVGGQNFQDVMALDTQDGSVAWKQRLTVAQNGYQQATLVRRGNTLAYLPRVGGCAALDLANKGNVLWRCNYPVPNTYWQAAEVSDEAIFLASPKPEANTQAVVVTRIDLAKGLVAWSADLPGRGQCRDLALSADYVLLSYSPMQVGERQIGNRKVTTLLGLPAEVHVLHQDDGRSEAVLKTVENQEPNQQFTYQPAWLAVGEEACVVGSYQGVVGFGKAPRRQ